MKFSEKNSAAVSLLTQFCLLSVLGLFLGSCSAEHDGYFQGYIEGEYIYISAPIGGQLESLAARKGQELASGAPAFVLEHAREQAGVSEAEKELAKAESLLSDLEKGRRPAEISVIEAKLAQARVSYDLARNEFERRKLLFKDNSIPREELDRARTEMERSGALVEQLAAELETAKLEARADLIDAARSEFEAAGYRLTQARWQLEQKSQAAPAAGIVEDTFFREGEYVPAAYPVVSLLPPANIKIRFFVPEKILGKLHLGQAVYASLDGVSPSIPAKISYISPEVEYTPPVIYSRETRAKLVFMIEAVPDEAAADLHPGQPVEVTLEPKND